MSSPSSSPIHAFQDSSPESSPALGPIDSSPPSSPALQSVSLSPPVSPGPAHPYAASTKAVKQPRLYEKRGRLSYDTDTFDEDEDTLTNRDHASRTLFDSAGSLSPRKKRPRTHYHARALSTGSTGSSVTDFPSGSHVEPRLLLFGAPRQSRCSMSNDSRDELAEIDLSDDEAVSVDHRIRPLSHVDREKHIWDDVITTAIDTADGYIDLQQEGLISTGLSCIPPSIADLASLVVLPSKKKMPVFKTQPSVVPRNRPFVRSVTLPGCKNTPFLHIFDPSRAKSSSVTLRQSPDPPGSAPLTNEVSLVLGNNSIAKLPVELFTLTNLTVLSMRNNLLTHIPPQISLLCNLRELNVARNRLVYLPAEMLEMRLEVLVIDDNPWLDPPLPGEDRGHTEKQTCQLSGRTTSQRSSLGGTTAISRRATVSTTVAKFSIPSLTEYCLRVLFAPYHDPSQMAELRDSNAPLPRPRTRLEATYELPLSHIEHYPPDIVNTLRACVPQSVAKPDPQIQASPCKRARRGSTHSYISSQLSDPFSTVEVEDEDASEGGEAAEVEETHSGIGTCMSPIHPRLARPVFVDPAEERFQWVRTIAGQFVHEDVPVLWRGCMPGCLSFLDEQPESTSNDNRDTPPGEKDTYVDGPSILLEDGEDGDGDDGVEAIDLGGGLGDEFD